MKEARIILPSEAVETQGVVDRLNEIIAEFGGFTQSHGHGVWKDPEDGQIWSETVQIYDIAIPETAEADAMLMSFARQMGAAGNQKTVYFRDSLGEVTILNTEPCPA